MPVTVQNVYSAPVSTQLLERAVRSLMKAEGLARAEVSILLTDDPTVHEMNRDYRGYDRPTDVLSFAQIEQAPGAPAIPATHGAALLLGDVVISVDTALRQAQTHGVTPAQELALLAVHGTLHLIGYEDETEAGAERMRTREKEILGIELR